MKLIFATHNEGKVKEMRQILAGLDAEIMSAEEAGVHEDVEEDGVTFAENALKKARFAAQKTREWAIADDSGICIEALNGNPGVQSARWAGEGADGSAIVKKTLEKMKDVPQESRGAYFESCAALVSPDGSEWTFSGRCPGKIIMTPRGTAHPKLPYDVLFVPEGKTKTFAEIEDEEKNSLSHRGTAFRKLKDFLEFTPTPKLLR